MGILGTKPAPADGLPPGAPRGREAERILAAELLAELRHIQQTMTGFVERIAGRITNHVLEVGTRAIGTDGTTRLSFGAPCGSLEVANLSQHTITVAAGPSATTTAPANGIGVYQVPAGAVRLVNLAQREITLYGTAADVFSYQAFTVGGLSGASMVGVDGGIA